MCSAALAPEDGITAASIADLTCPFATPLLPIYKEEQALSTPAAGRRTRVCTSPRDAVLHTAPDLARMQHLVPGLSPASPVEAVLHTLAWV